jgi:DNA-binding HxlR family transcriptional regulator
MPSAIQHFVAVIKLRWSVTILKVLRGGPMRYTDLQRVITLSTGENVHNRPLTESLRRLEDRCLIDHPSASGGGSVYRLTPVGAELVDLLGHLEGWSERHLTPR